jgi:hypothetical protein
MQAETHMPQLTKIIRGMRVTVGAVAITAAVSVCRCT